MRLRFLLGLVSGVLALISAFAGIRSLVVTIKATIGLRMPGLLLPGLLSPIILGVSAYVLARIAYRGLFWRRYVATLRARTHLDRTA